MRTLTNKIRTANRTAMLRKIQKNILKEQRDNLAVICVTKTDIIKKYGKKAGIHFRSLFNLFSGAEWAPNLEGEVFYI